MASAMRTASNRHVVAREHNVLRVDFSREPDPPAPRFPGANAMRQTEDIGEQTFACAAVTAA